MNEIHNHTQIISWNPIIELRHLKTLLALEETGTVFAGCQARSFSPIGFIAPNPRARKFINETPLFERANPDRCCAAHPAGERLLQLARDLMPQVVAAERDMAQIIRGRSGRIRGWPWNPHLLRFG